MKEKHGNKASKLHYKGCSYIGKERIVPWEKRRGAKLEEERMVELEGRVRSK